MKCINALLVAVLLFCAKTSHACSICFYGDPAQKANIAVKNAIYCLLLILAVLMALFIKFFISVRKRSKHSSGSGV